ncbi:MAG: B-box zinc finger protein [Chloroflexota bacterium]
MTQTSAPQTCANHPEIETTLRCNRCEKPICPKCAVLTPTGYRCKECVRGQQKKFDTAEWYDYVFGFITAGLLSLIGSLLISLVGGIGFIGWFLVVISAPTAGAIIAEAVRRVIRRHRARSLFTTIVIAVALGAMPMVLIHVLSLNLFGILFQGIYLVLVTPAVYYRLSGIQLFK